MYIRILYTFALVNRQEIVDIHNHSLLLESKVKLYCFKTKPLEEKQNYRSGPIYTIRDFKEYYVQNIKQIAHEKRSHFCNGRTHVLHASTLTKWYVTLHGRLYMHSRE